MSDSGENRPPERPESSAAPAPRETRSDAAPKETTGAERSAEGAPRRRRSRRGRGSRSRRPEERGGAPAATPGESAAAPAGELAERPVSQASAPPTGPRPSRSRGRGRSRSGGARAPGGPAAAHAPSTAGAAVPPALSGGAPALEAATNRAIELVLDAGRWAPTAHNTQPQAFVVARDPATRAKIVARAGADREAGVLHWPMPWFAEAPALIAVLYDPSRKEPVPCGSRTALLGIGAVLESMRIAADAAGAAWTEWRPSAAAETELRALLGFPATFECHAVIGLVPERPSFPPPPSLSAPFSETFGHADSMLRVGPIARGSGTPQDVLARRRTARGHFESAPLAPEVLRALVSGTARAGRAAGIAAPRLIYVQSPTEIGRLADVMFEIASALFRDVEFNRAIGAWQSFDEAEWKKRGDGLLALGKGGPKLLTSQARGLWNRISVALGGSAIDEMVKETMSELVREAPLVIAWALEPEAGAASGARPATASPSDRRIRAAAIIDAGASTLRTLYDAERLGLGAQGVPMMLESPPRTGSGEERVKTILGIPASHDVVNVVRVGKIDTQDTPPSINWRSDVRRDASKMFFRERYTAT